MYGQRWEQKPPPGTQVDPASALGENLVWMAPLWEGSGSKTNNITSGQSTQSASLTLTGSAAWSAGLMSGLSCAGTSGNIGASATIPAWLQIGAPLTIAVAFRCLGSTLKYGTLLGLFINNTNASPFVAANISYFTTSGALQYYYGIAGASSTVGSANFTASVGTDHVAVMSLSSTGMTFFVDGQQTISVGTGCVPSYGSTPLIGIGNYASASGFSSNSLIYWAAVWNSTFSAPFVTGNLSTVNSIWSAFYPRRDIRRYVSSGAAIVAFPINPLVVRQPLRPVRRQSIVQARSPGGNPTQIPRALPPKIIRQPSQPSKSVQAKSPGGNPTVRPKNPAISPFRLPAQTVRLILLRARYASPQFGFPPRYIPIRPGKPVRLTQAISLHSKYAAPVTNPFPPRYVPIPFRQKTRGGWPLFLRQSIPGSSPPVVPPIAFNLNAWAALLLSSDADPLAVNPGGAVAVSSDGDPLAVDFDDATQIN
jgi:hypothetical protein